ncbi:Ppx/GppA family phosphatase [uncultured Slackia sp.]|uniref:Ppx/GppA phosphatase family protein n=1 Tax=uncultured Slackia sp. TaxID=665903 RepID=UPI0026DFB663|nr:Ppx/GppA family phosphatase [uncultured Slackia sp.]
MRIAAIDIGTVTSRLLVADVNAAGVQTVLRRSTITDLGVGVDATGRLAAEAIERTVDAVGSYKKLIDECDAQTPVDRVTALATSASRDAENADEFVGRLHAVGVDLSVIPGNREAELSFLGASNDFRGENLLFADIGGGSTELALGRADAPAGALVPEVSMRSFRSFNVGCRRMTERFLHGDPPSDAEYAEARAWAAEELAPFFADADLHVDRLVVVAGTPTSVVAVRDALVPYDSSKVHKALVSRQQFDDVRTRLSRMALADRMQVPGIQPKRAGVFPAGALILDAVMDLAGVEAFTASESDILMGIVLDAARGSAE